MNILNIDFETRSSCDLPACGTHKYARDPSTEILMMAWAFDDGPIDIWLPGDEFPDDVTQHLAEGGLIHAWNAQFERLLVQYILAPQLNIAPPDITQYRCTAAQARAHGLPSKLANCAKALDLPLQKDSAGTRLITKYSIKYSSRYVPFEDATEEDRRAFIQYCLRDTEVEREIGKLLRPLTDQEWAEYHLNEVIADKGIPVDINTISIVVDAIAQIRTEVAEKLTLLTDGQVKSINSRKARNAWLTPKLTFQQLATITQTAFDPERKTVAEKISFDKTHRAKLIASPNLPQPVRDYLQLVEDGGTSALKKYQRILDRAMDGHVYGALIFGGAGQTGRFSSTGIQLHNLRRDTLDDPEAVIEDLHLNKPHTSDTLARLIRNLIAGEEGMTWYDWSSIEGRMAPWLADSPPGELKLELYRQGEDPYIHNAAAYYRTSPEHITSDQRQIGKIQELSLQYLGGVKALQSMALNYGLTIDDEIGKSMRDAWRAANPWAMEFGLALENAALHAVNQRGSIQDAGRVHFTAQDDWLWLLLPCGRKLAYYQPQIELGETPWGEPKHSVTCLWGSSLPKKGMAWPRRTMHAGIWIENTTQGAAASLLRETITHATDAGLDVRLHCHDEILVNGFKSELAQVMLQNPLWAEGLPLDGDGASGYRYKLKGEQHEPNNFRL